MSRQFVKVRYSTPTLGTPRMRGSETHTDVRPATPTGATRRLGAVVESVSLRESEPRMRRKTKMPRASLQCLCGVSAMMVGYQGTAALIGSSDHS